MKCRRKNFGKHLQPSREHYWDQNRQVVVSVPGQVREAGMRRRLRRHGYEDLQRAKVAKSKADNYVDRIVSVEKTYEGQVERVGDKFRILDGDEQEA